MNRLSASVAAVEDEEYAAAVDSRRVVLYGVVAARASGGWRWRGPRVSLSTSLERKVDVDGGVHSKGGVEQR
jgi:hypothetical protein